MSRLIQFMIAGAEKAGTSSLKEYVGEHPAISMHPQEEIMHFALDDQYALGFHHAQGRYYHHATGILAGKSVAILHVDEASLRLHEHNPGVKLVVVLRNPVDRAYSAYWHARRRGWEHLETFEAALRAEEERLSDHGPQARRFGYQERGRYGVQLERLMERFPGNVRVFLLEDLEADAAAVCQDIFEDLGVDSSFVPAVEERYNAISAARSERVAGLLSRDSAPKRMLKRLAPQRGLDYVRLAIDRFNAKTFTPPPMNPATRRRLVEDFLEPNDQLAELIGRDLSAWNT